MGGVILNVIPNNISSQLGLLVRMEYYLHEYSAPVAATMNDAAVAVTTSNATTSYSELLLTLIARSY